MNKTALTAFLIALAPYASADLITWGPVQDTTAVTDVSASGTLVAARNFFPQGSPAAPVINGIQFAAFNPQGWANGGGGTLAGSTTGDTAYDAMLDGARATSEATTMNPSVWGGIRLDDLGTLNVGSTYEIQVWYCEQRLGGNPTNPVNERSMVLSSATGVAALQAGAVTNLGSLTLGTNSDPLAGDPNLMSGAGDTVFGQHVRGTFTRTSSDELWLLVQGTHPVAANNLRPHVNGLQVREIAQASSFCNGDGGNQMGCTGCPCGNDAAPGTPAGCLNSSGTASGLVQSGSASIAAADLRFEAGGAPATAVGMLFSGVNQAPANAGNPCFGQNSGVLSAALDGLRCVSQGLMRHGMRAIDANGSIGVTNSGWGAPDGFTNLGAFGTGQTRHFQMVYTDSALSVCQSGLNTSQAISVTFQP